MTLNLIASVRGGRQNAMALAAAEVFGCRAFGSQHNQTDDVILKDNLEIRHAHYQSS
jgi:hypothetical protein